MTRKRLLYIFPFLLIAVILIAIWWYIDDTRSQTYCISLSLGESEPRMLKNGETVEADEGLIVRNQVPFVPLEEVVVQLGGAYESVTDAAGQTTGAVFSLPWPSAPNKRHTSQIWLGRTDFHCDDEPVPNKWGGYGWGGYMHSQPEERTPFLENGTVYVPLHYLQLSGGSTVLWDSDRRRAIITAAYNEGGISTIPLRRTFFKLNPSLRTGLSRGESQAGNDAEIYYGNGDILLHVGENPSDFFTIFRQVRGVTLLSDRYATQRGLRVGDSAERFYDLYGSPAVQDTIGDQMQVVLKDGCVAQIRFAAH